MEFEVDADFGLPQYSATGSSSTSGSSTGAASSNGDSSSTTSGSGGLGSSLLGTTSSGGSGGLSSPGVSVSGSGSDYRVSNGSGAPEFPTSRARTKMFWDSSFGSALGMAQALAGRLVAGAMGSDAADAADARLAAMQKAGQVVEVVVAYLTSYEHMGRVRLSCVSGCGCKPQEVDAHHKQHTSVSATTVLPVWPRDDHTNGSESMFGEGSGTVGGIGGSNSGSSSIGGSSSGSTGGSNGVSGSGLSRCVLRVEVLPGTGSGEHKFKVIQVVSRAKQVWVEPPQLPSPQRYGGGSTAGGPVRR